MIDVRRDGTLDGLRAVAALSVLLFHVWLYRPGGLPGPRDALGDKLLFECSRGLMLFFVLSGFLLYRPFLRRRVDLPRYALRRVARIVPAYYVCVLGCLALYAAIGYDAIVPAGDRLALFAVFAQNYSADTVMQLDPVTWTLCVEVAFYLVLPLLALAARGRARVTVLLALVAATLLWNGAAPGLLASKALPAYIGHFALGMLVAVWAERGVRLSRTSTAALVAAGCALLVLNGYWHETAAPSDFVRAVLANLPAALGFALVLAAAVAGSGPSVAWLRARPLAAIGTVSYGVYLWHVPLLLALRETGALPAPLALRFAMAAPLALLAGTASWLLVERPSLHSGVTPRAGRRASRASLARPRRDQCGRATAG